MTEPTDGSVVRLNSGGPAMTVIRVDDARCECAWFSHGEMRSATFSLASVRAFVPVVPANGYTIDAHG